jgi:hypothetical protein
VPIIRICIQSRHILYITAPSILCHFRRAAADGVDSIEFDGSVWSLMGSLVPFESLDMLMRGEITVNQTF